MAMPRPTPPRTPRIGLALGSGSARGWAHIGVLRALLEAGIRPDVVCGASVGAIVGAAYASGELDRFESWVRTLDRRKVLSFMDFRLSGGVLKGEKLVGFLRSHFDDRPMQALPMPYAAVATALHTGDEVWLREGSVADAVRASFALPGLFTPVWREGRLLVDGGLVNPVPVSLARALGADVVIAVDLNSDKLERFQPRPAPEAGARNGWVQSLQHGLGALWPRAASDTPPADGEQAPNGGRATRLPSLISVVTDSIHVMQVRITRSRMAGDPPEATIAPHLAQLGLLDFHRADEAIAVGHAAAQEVLPLLRARGLGHADAADVPEAPTVLRLPRPDRTSPALAHSGARPLPALPEPRHAHHPRQRRHPDLQDHQPRRQAARRRHHRLPARAPEPVSESRGGAARAGRGRAGGAGAGAGRRFRRARRGAGAGDCTQRVPARRQGRRPAAGARA